jgi:hypothetical protein
VDVGVSVLQAVFPKGLAFVESYSCPSRREGWFRVAVAFAKGVCIGCVGVWPGGSWQGTVDNVPTYLEVRLFMNDEDAS